MRLFLALCVGTVLMAVVICFCRRWYALSLKNALMLTPILTVCGFLSVKLMFFIENGTWKGLSFFGAIFFVPLLFILVSKLLHRPYLQILDLAAPAICIMLALMKVECLVTGCCKGMVLYENAVGEQVRFPSQIVELINALVIMVILILLMRKEKCREKIYSYFAIFYGGTRFVLNLFRETTELIWGLAIGNIWSVVSVILGFVFLAAIKTYTTKTAEQQSD